jgi:hypothetical protein
MFLLLWDELYRNNSVLIGNVKSTVLMQKAWKISLAYVCWVLRLFAAKTKISAEDIGLCSYAAMEW